MHSPMILPSIYQVFHHLFRCTDRVSAAGGADNHNSAFLKHSAISLSLIFAHLTNFLLELRTVLWLLTDNLCHAQSQRHKPGATTKTFQANLSQFCWLEIGALFSSTKSPDISYYAWSLSLISLLEKSLHTTSSFIHIILFASLPKAEQNTCTAIF